MRDGQGHFYIAGMRVEPESQEKSGFADWVLKQHRIVIRKGKLHWRDEFRENAALNLEQVDFVMNNRGRRHRFRLTAMPDSGLAKSLDIRGDLSHPRFVDRVSDLSKWTGDFIWMFRISILRNGENSPICRSAWITGTVRPGYG